MNKLLWSAVTIVKCGNSRFVINLHECTTASEPI